MVQMQEVLKVAALYGKCIEINASPRRLELDWRYVRQATEMGIRLSINPDAHSTAEIDLTHWGVEMARKGGVSRDRVLNCLDLPTFAEYLIKRRARAKRTARRR